jgi:hypothetical protein
VAAGTPAEAKNLEVGMTIEHEMAQERERIRTKEALKQREIDALEDIAKSLQTLQGSRRAVEVSDARVPANR